MKKTAITILFLLLCFFSNAQLAEKKVHYAFINPAMEQTLVYEKALYNTDVDGLRFLNERRVIAIEGSYILIELFSANELLKAYGKEISPLTITNAVSVRSVKFKLAENKSNLTIISAIK